MFYKRRKCTPAIIPFNIHLHCSFLFLHYISFMQKDAQPIHSKFFVIRFKADIFFPHWSTLTSHMWWICSIQLSRSWILPWKKKIDRIYVTCLLKSWHLHVCLQALVLGQHWCSLISSVKMPWCLRAILACGVSVLLHSLTPEALQSLQAYQGPFHSPQKSKPDLFIV